MTSPIVSPHTKAFVNLRQTAESFEDVLKAKIAIENRLRSGMDSDPIAKALNALDDTKNMLSLAMRNEFRKAVPEVAAWVKGIVGVGATNDHLVARLVACIGHPVITTPYYWLYSTPPPDHECIRQRCGENRHLIAGEPFARSVSQLWSYCGHGDATRKRRKGMTADEAMALGNPRAKMLVHLISERCKMCKGTTTRRRSPYRDIYDLGRSIYADRVDAQGKPWTLAHQDNAALRLVGKEFLRDLWVAAH